MSKRVLFFLLALLLLFSLACSSRPGPAHPASQNIQQTQEQQVVDAESLDAGESCDGVGEEECLIRRTLVAHVDYIYTQKHKNP